MTKAELLDALMRDPLLDDDDRRFFQSLLAPDEESPTEEG